MISIAACKRLPEMMALKKLYETQPGHDRQSVYLHSLKALKAMRSLSKSRFLHLLALLHDVGKAKTMVKKGRQILFPKHDEAGAEIVAGLDLGLGRKQHANAVKLVRNHLTAFENQDWKREILRKSGRLARAQMLLAISDLKGGDGWRLDRRGYLRKSRVFKEALREFS